MHLLLAH